MRPAVILTFDKNLTAVLDPTNQDRGADQLGNDPEERLSWAFSVSGAYLYGVRLGGRAPGVAVSGSTVTLTLGSDMKFLPDTKVSVSYDADFAALMGAILRDDDGNAVSSFSRTMVTTGGTVRPLLTAAHVAGKELTLTFDKALDKDSAPAGSRFQVVAYPVDWDGPGRFIQGTGTAVVSASTVTLTLASAVEQGETAEVAYSKGDDANPLRDAAGARPEVADFWWTQATVLDRTVPKLDSVFATDSTLFLYYDEKLDTGSTPDTSAFSVTVGTTPATVSAAEIREYAVELGYSSSASGAVTVGYSVPASNPIRDVAGNAAAAFSGRQATVSDTAAAPALTGAKTNGYLVTLTFDRALSPSNVPAASAFTVWDLLDKQTSTDFDWLNQTILSVAVRGREVVLDVSPGISSACVSQPRVDYTQPATGALSNLGTGKVASFSEQSITHLNTHRCVSNAVKGAFMGSSGASGDGSRRMSMQFDRPLQRRSLPKKEAFAVTPQDGGAPVEVEDVRIPEDDLTRLMLTLSRPLADGERATASYRPRRSGASLEDIDGNILAPFSVEVEAPPAEVEAPPAEAVAVVSDPGGDATYAAGDAVRVRVTFGEAVAVDTGGGTPRLKLDLDPADGGERWAAYEGGSGTNELTFAWEAASGDLSTAGVAVLADTLELDGGVIRSAATGADAALGHAGLAHDPAHKVDAAPPELVRGEIDGGTMTLWFSEALDPHAAGGEFHMAVEVPETGVVGFRATGDVAIDGATVTVGMGDRHPRATAGLEGNFVRYFRRADGADGALRDLAGNPVLTPHGSRRTTQDGTVETRYVKIDLDNVTEAGPTVTGVALVSDPGGDPTYAAGDAVRVRVTFGEAVAVDTGGGTPRLKLDLDPADGGERWAPYEGGTGTNELSFAYAVVSGDVSSGGVAVLADTLELDGGAIRSAATGSAAALGHAGLAHDPAHKVDTSGPALTSASVSGTALTVTFGEALDAGSAPAGSAFIVSAARAQGACAHHRRHGRGGLRGRDGPGDADRCGRAWRDGDARLRAARGRPAARRRGQRGGGVLGRGGHERDARA